MKMTSVLGILVSVATLNSCAPVASSSPKLSATRPRGDSGVMDSGKDKKFDLGVVAKTEVVSADKYDAYEKTLGEYRFVKIQENDAEISELLETRGIKEVKLATNLSRIEIVTIFVVDMPEKALAKEKNSEVKVEWLRGEKDQFSLAIEKEGTSEEAWTFIKKNLNRVTIAYRKK